MSTGKISDKPAPTTPASAAVDVERATRERYAGAASAPEAALCCPTDYDARYLEAIPDEVLAKDYGCGDPSRHARPGDTVLDLGSGTGKIAFILSQVVGPEGRVIGVDMTPEMLDVARRNAPAVAGRIGHANVEFRRGRIQDLRLDVDRLEAWLRRNPVGDAAGLEALRDREEGLRLEAPLVPDESVDLVVSNCVLNLVRPEDKERLFGEMYRVLRTGGRVAISDIVADEEVPAHLVDDSDLWSGCLSGAYREDRFLRAFERAGFHGIALASFGSSPWRTVEGIEFRSVTVTAHKGKEGPCLERNQAVIYGGPWRTVTDDDGHTYRRGERAAVCDKTFRILTGAPYADEVIPVPPREEIPLDAAGEFDCRPRRRDPRETKGREHRDTRAAPDDGCAPGDCC